MERWRNELYHHGIIGQKWGVRRFQYEDGSLTPAGRDRYLKGNQNGRARLEDSGKEFVKNNNGFATETIVAAALAPAVIYAVRAAAKEIRLRWITRSEESIEAFYDKPFPRDTEKERQKQFARATQILDEKRQDSNEKTADELSKLNEAIPTAKSCKQVNPYPEDDPGGDQNCMCCTAAMALREKGYDVVAKRSLKGMPREVHELSFKGAKTDYLDHADTDMIVDKMKSYGDHAYGNFIFNWRGGGGHSVFWKIENGTPVIYDGQAGVSFKCTNTNLMWTNLVDNKIYKSVELIRLDNTPPTDYVLGLVTPTPKRRKTRS